MIDILLSQPGTCLYPVFVLLMLLWALWTGRKHSANGAERLSCHPAKWAYRPLFSCLDYPPSVLRDLHASCSADYAVKFEMVSKRIQRG